MKTTVILDTEDALFLLQFLPAMKDNPDSPRTMRIISEVQAAIEPHKQYTVNVGKIDLHSTFSMKEAVEKLKKWEPPKSPLLKVASISDPHLLPGLYFRPEVCMNKVQAIKLVRAVLGWGLKDAKDAVDTGGWLPIPAGKGPYDVAKTVSNEGYLVSVVEFAENTI